MKTKRTISASDIGATLVLAVFLALTILATSCSHLREWSKPPTPEQRAAREHAAAVQVQTLERLALERRLYR